MGWGRGGCRSAACLAPSCTGPLDLPSKKQQKLLAVALCSSGNNSQEGRLLVRSAQAVLSFLSWTPSVPLPRLLLEQKGKPVSREPFPVAVWVGCFPARVLTSACSRPGESSLCLSWWKAQVPPQKARAHFLRRRWAWEDKAAVVCEPPKTSLPAAPTLSRHSLGTIANVSFWGHICLLGHSQYFGTIAGSRGQNPNHCDK